MKLKNKKLKAVLENKKFKEINAKLKAALQYAKKGWSVSLVYGTSKNGNCDCGKSDCDCPGKHPRTKNGHKDAITDIDTIKQWWEKYPDSNIGIATGKDSIIVLDIDGKEGRKSLAALEKQYGKLPITVTVITGNGKHYWFKSSVVVKNSTSKVGKKLDVRGDGGYIIAPPSNHYSGKTYRFKEGQGLDDVEIAEVPEWLLGLMLADKQKSSLNTGNARNLPVKLTNSSVIPSGQRNDTLFRLGCYLRSKGHEYDSIYDHLTKSNMELCQPPLDSREIDTITKSCMRYSPGGLQESLQYTNEWLTKNSDVDFDKILSDDNLIISLAIISKEDSQEFAKIIMFLKKQGLTSRNQDELRKIVNVKKNELKNAVLVETDIGLPITAFLENPPVSPDTLIPSGYEIDCNGIRLITGTKNSITKIVSTAPILFSHKFKDMTNGTEYLTLLWYKNGVWENESVPRTYVADTQKIVTLASRGFPVTTANARDVVGFLYLLESVNISNIPTSEISSQIGWIGEKGEKGFLFGLKYISPDGKAALMNADLKQLDTKQHDDKSIFFYNADGGEQRFAESFCFKGKYVKWLEIIDIINKKPIIAFFVYGALAAPLLKLLDQPNFIIDLSGITTSGKTTTMKVAASVFGNPNAIIRTWNNTQVYIERTASMHIGLPLFLDDTKLIKDKEVISKIIYEGSAGQGRGRGTIFGTAPVPKWNTVILSTGESSILDLTNKSDGGAHGRVIAICSPPFPDKNRKNANTITKLDSIISKNFGRAGIKYIRYLLKNMEQLPQWKTELAKIKKTYDKKEARNIMNRLHGYFACIHLAAKLFIEACPDCKLDFERHIDTVYQLVAHDVEKSSDAAKSALKVLYDHCISHQEDFYDTQQDRDKHQPARGWIGIWEDEVAVIPSVLSDILTKNGYEPKSIIRDWKQKGWLKKDKNGDNPKFTIGKDRIRCVVIKADILNNITDNKL